MAECGIRIRIDSSQLFSSKLCNFRYFWTYLPFDSVGTIRDLKLRLIENYLRITSTAAADDIQLYLSEPFVLFDDESIRVLQDGDLVVAKTSPTFRFSKTCKLPTNGEGDVRVWKTPVTSGISSSIPDKGEAVSLESSSSDDDVAVCDKPPLPVKTSMGSSARALPKGGKAVTKVSSSSSSNEDADGTLRLGTRTATLSKKKATETCVKGETILSSPPDQIKNPPITKEQQIPEKRGKKRKRKRKSKNKNKIDGDLQKLPEGGLESQVPIRTEVLPLKARRNNPISTISKHVYFDEDSEGEAVPVEDVESPAEVVIDQNCVSITDTAAAKKPRLEQNGSGISCEEHLLLEQQERLSDVQMTKKRQEGRSPGVGLDNLLNLAKTTPICVKSREVSLVTESSPNGSPEVWSNASVILRNNRDLEDLPTLEEFPRPNDMIAFKVLEMSETYEPVVSEYKTGRVASVDPLQKRLEVAVEEPVKGKTREGGKFEIDLEGQEPEQEGLKYFCWNQLIQPKLIPKA